MIRPEQPIAAPRQDSHSLTQKLERRLAIDERSLITGHAFRRNARGLAFERHFTKPVVQAILQMSGLYAVGLRNALQPVLRRITLDFADLPMEFDGFTILHLSDFHIDGIEGLADAVAPLLKQLRPSVCLMTGDYRFDIEGSSEEVVALMRKVVSCISTDEGTFAILGNHDPTEIAFALQQMGVHMLINDACPIRRGSQAIALLGVDDPYDYQCDRLDLAIAAAAPDSFKILLAHTPDLYQDAESQAVRLYLCGHTHAGQIRLPGLGSVVSNSKAPRRYTAGLWKYKKMHGYTSAGIGCSLLPVRFRCPPELVLIELRRRPSQNFQNG